ncbi:SNF2 family N-terminal domain-containing protein [Infundibulicybe gibba]|nr:SNF2 family N-terminal domain-containing protein [Infundibulicybe gibba]
MSSGRHAVGYSKSTRAKCHGPQPCYGSALDVGTLRYGHTIPGEFGEQVEWRHWGCVTPSILVELAPCLAADTIVGFHDLSPTDQQKIRLAVSIRRIDPANFPATSKPSSSNTAPTSTQNGKKRKAVSLNISPGFASNESAVTSSTHVAASEEDVDVPLEEETKDELYCTLSTNVVGIQYYTGLVGSGEAVMLVREPANPYDRNAIQVKNIGNTQVGHLPRTVVSKLAPLLDQKLVTVEGIMTEGNLTGRKGYTLSMTLKIYGASDIRPQLEPRLMWATPGHGDSSHKTRIPPLIKTRLFVPLDELSSLATQRAVSAKQTAAQIEAARKNTEALQKAAELKQLLNNSEKINDGERRDSLLDSLCSVDDILALPTHPDPPGIKNGNLRVDLLKHQSQALQWCIEREYPVVPKNESDRPVQFWQLKKTGNKPYYYNVATKTPQAAPPPLGRGALCADAMVHFLQVLFYSILINLPQGLGKTLTMLALVLATQNDNTSEFAKSTLIVAPLSVLSNWEKQIDDHCTPGSLSFCVYYGSSRSMTTEQLQQHDVVITTYQTVAGENPDATKEAGPSKKKKRVERTLFDIQWKRIILDEGHTIRNPQTQIAKAVCGLRAQRRWVLSGTPIINSPRVRPPSLASICYKCDLQDLGSLLSFLKICQPFDNEEFYKRLLLRPLKDGNPAGVELLRALMSQICIRRTKEMQDSSGNPLIPLPPVEMIIVPVALSDEARALYDEVEQLSKQRLETYMNQTSATVGHSNVLSMLTRMRQIALHPALVPANYVQELRAQDVNPEAPAQLKPPSSEEKLRLQGLLAQAIEDCEECPICLGILSDARITSCAHMFCFPCIEEVISRDPKCPMDRRLLSMADLHEPPPPTELTQAPFPREAEALEEDKPGSSSKIEQLVHLLRLTPATEKSLVFSQFTSFLNKIAEALDKESIPYVRFDGQMSAKRRRDAITKFSVPLDEISDDVNPKVMLISLKAGALGLNLTVANNVYLMDPWWQEGIESQAVDRVNRIGQKKPVHVYQLIAENTVEAKVLNIQERKKKLIQEAFSGIKRKETQRQQKEARLQDLIELFGIRQQSS